MHYAALLVLQALIVAFLALHDWIPLPPLNDVRAVQAADSRARLLWVTAISTLPFAFGLAASVHFAAAPRPGWLAGWLTISYALLLAGALRAWWIPYAFGTDAARVARYEKMFGRTHAFLPARNGIRPNTLHLAFHVAVVAVLALVLGGGPGLNGNAVPVLSARKKSGPQTRPRFPVPVRSDQPSTRTALPPAAQRCAGSSSASM